MVNSNKLIIATASYQLITALVCLFFVFIGAVQNLLSDYIIIAGLAVSGLILLVTILTNIQILVYRDRLKPHYFTVNAVICLVQSIHLFTDGFYYKYLQGFGLIGYVALVHSTKAVLWGVFLKNLTWEFMFKFDESENTLVGINFIAFALMLYFYWLSRNISRSGGRLPLKEE